MVAADCTLAPMRVLVAPDKFRGTLTAAQAARAVAAGWRRARPDDDVVEVPMADGGEGTLDAMVDGLRGERRRVRVSGPLGDPVESGFGVVPGPSGLTAIVEMARASGLDLDLRRDQPHDAYGDLRFLVPVEDGGDVRARLMVRAREVEQSVSLLRQALEGLPEGGTLSPLPETLPSASSALGWAEGWRGECLHWVETDAEGRLARVKVTDPSFKNWPALARCVPGNIVPDFPVINKSFNLSYSGNDR